MEKLATRLAFVALFGFSLPSFAQVVGVQTIDIFSSAPDWLQVSEVVATQYGTGIDVALATQGATATAIGSIWPGSSPSYAIDGVAPASFPNIYHSGTSDGSTYLQITLASPASLDSLTIYGRTDCCSNRDIYNVSLLNSSGGVVYQDFGANANNDSHSVTLNFPAAPVPEPTEGALMMSGIGLLGFVASRRKKSA